MLREGKGAATFILGDEGHLCVRLCLQENRLGKEEMPELLRDAKQACRLTWNGGGKQALRNMGRWVKLTLGHF